MFVAKVRLSACSRSTHVLRKFTSKTSSESQSELDDHLNYCAQLIENRDYDSFLATRLLPLQNQERIFPILALNAEVSVIRQKILRNSGVAGIYQLQFWKDALNTLAGQMRGPIPRQPVVRALEHFKVVNKDNLQLFHELVSARQETLGDRPFESVEKLEANSRAVHGTLIHLIGQQLANQDSEAFREVSNDMGTAVGIAILLRATIPLLKEGVVLLPLDLLSLYGLTPDSFFRNEFPKGMKDVTRDLCKIIEHRSKKARSKLSSIYTKFRPALLSSGLRVDHVLETLRRSDYNVLSTPLQKPPNFIASTLWWRYKRGKY